MTKKILCVGAGFSGCVIARELAEKLNANVDIIDLRNHIGGNCYTEKDTKTGITFHKYGPHIFHTSDLEVWNYVNKFTKFYNFIYSVKAKTHKGIFILPINLLTINQFFGLELNPNEAEKFIKEKQIKFHNEPQNLEEQALSFLGKELYEVFIYGYTKKQWGVDPKELPAFIIKRLPVRFNYYDNYYFDIYSGIPENGYTEIFEKILDHPKINVILNTKFDKNMIKFYDHIFYSGKIDEFYDYQFGELSYRTVYWEYFYDTGDYQGASVINYCEEKYPYTRIIEHKHFEFWKTYSETICSKEFSREAIKNEIPFYPKRLKPDLEKLEKYGELMKNEDKVTFVGRLGTYRYLDMHIVIREALDIAQNYITIKGF